MGSASFQALEFGYIALENSCFMTFEFIPAPGFSFLKSFSEKFKIPVHNNRLILPDYLGEGTIRMVDMVAPFKLFIHRYKTKEEFVFKRVAPPVWIDNITLIFYNSVFPESIVSNPAREQFTLLRNNSGIEISSNDLNSTVRFPAGVDIDFTVVGIDRTMLLESIGLEKTNHLLEVMNSKHRTFLFYEDMTLDVEKVLRQIAEISDQNELANFLYKIKIEELLYLVLDKMLKRADERPGIINKNDIDKLYTVRTAVLADLSVPPQLRELAKTASMSETKLKQLFKQVFGDTIYSYYQKARMEEAAFLLKQAHSVSEVGYQMGFRSLSHFTKVFQQHYGVTPKKYTAAG